ncbi:PEP-CTERM sorting domain-containing protein [Geminisphaera colitermitum]|uniref:PEP-CTERM sorting domain-containing protein n=1 Tax=Geminisphaera colitermitum TaxID=1148786 RepID=UPI000158C943|nr:PEP-CTERM sorting domain-containing protein [Geminisphaera colitermitum]
MKTKPGLNIRHLIAATSLLAALAPASRLRAETKDTTLTAGDNWIVTTATGLVTSANRNIAASNSWTGFVTFDLTGVDLSTVTNVTLKLYLSYNASNNQNLNTVYVNAFGTTTTATPAASDPFVWTEKGTAVGTAVIGTDPGIDPNNGAVHGMYYTWDITSLVTQSNLISINGSSVTLGLVVSNNGTSFTGDAHYRFTPGTPANGGESASRNGLPAQIVLTQDLPSGPGIPEPATTALLGSVIVLTGALAFRRKLR